MRLVLAMMRHETNTFSPLPTPLRSFGPKSGQSAVEVYRGTNNPLAAFLDIAEREGAEYAVPMIANANPSGAVDSAAFEEMADRICDAVRAGCDGVMLDLHGAMVTQEFDDGEDELLRRIRAIADEMPIAVALDFHTNLTASMVGNATVITGYRTYPHIDMGETGRRAGETLIGAMRGEVQPMMLWHSLLMLTHMLCQTPHDQPMKDIMDRAMAAEAAEAVLNASVFGGFPLADIPHVGLSAVVVGDGDAAKAGGLLDELMEQAWDRRADFVFEIEPIETSLARARELDDGLVILVDHGDNCGAGGPQDNMNVLEQVLNLGLEDVAAGPIWDPGSVAQMLDAGVGAQVTLLLGGKTDSPAMDLLGRPISVSGTVRCITDGRFVVTGPMATGSRMNMGRTAVLRVGSIDIVISERRHEPFDTGCFTHAGIDPAAKRYVLIKSRQHFRAGFDPIAKHVVLVAGPGVCSSNYEAFGFKNLRRPIYPLDIDTSRNA
ncbi:MAG: M81 family metallopeptidase [Alphaproteobacteria bacterium]|jgi:microcystin degradation protein MlrC|nr:ABC transporter substrate-binding protein [Rhodospirillaceae bacterium]MDP6023096.1 M81 family metallopeptidase [Alphaproteobacteria bacterium]MDP6256099.1 M81 family metallopeptidase [Alphaproteobacteria bacterium]MDP7054647.1 M81 family metallopeptidase [Alphaproteobacteria bacterium]MDP7228607.1 M81 family metallopeptidase [Alphaproteobacteria bacterium]|tara:strand:+ start:1535 stop:3010 length:1476 start_codon:yes stop_codon:yes gene_type:complete